MKKQILITCSTALTVFFTTGAFAQTWVYPSPDIVTTPDVRNVIIDNAQHSAKLGINTNSPIDALTVNGDIGMTSTTGLRTIKASSPAGGVQLFSGNSYLDGAYILMRGVSHSGSGFGDNGRLTFCAASNNSDLMSMGMEFLTYNTSTNQWTNNMTLRKDGRVLIGSQIISDFYNSLPPDWDEIPDGYKLYVQDGILTEKVKVAVRNTADWSDYVFADNYKLRPLHEVANFIQDNKHLPDVPSAAEVVKTGIDLGKMDAKLLQKIEELTLYVIDLQKQNEHLNEKINKIEANSH